MAQNACCVWDFTAPEHMFEDVAEEGDMSTESVLKELLTDMCKMWTFQLEEGTETGYRHFQGRVSLKIKRRFPTFGSEYHFHWSPTSNANKDNNFYVLKDETRIRGPWSYPVDTNGFIPSHLQNITLHPWQEYIKSQARFDRIERRTINVVVDPEGNKGKSFLAMYLTAHGLAECIPPVDSFKDVMQMVMGLDKVPLYIIDLPRGLPKERMGSFYSGVETVKNGYAFDTRYKMKRMLFEIPNIWVFSNSLPDKQLMSRDRWKFWSIDANQHLVPYIVAPNLVVLPYDMDQIGPIAAQHIPLTLNVVRN